MSKQTGYIKQCCLAVVVAVVGLLGPVAPAQAQVQTNERASQQAGPLVLQPAGPPLPVKSDVLITAAWVDPGQGPALIELHNRGKKPASVAGWQLRVERTNAEEEVICQVDLDGYLLPAGYASWTPSGNGGTYQLPDCQQPLAAVGSVRVQLLSPDGVVETVELPDAAMYVRHSTAARHRTGRLATDFTAQQRPPMTGQLYQPPAGPGPQLQEVLPHPSTAGGCAAAGCQSYVKLTNPTDQIIDLAAYRLVIGSSKGVVRATYPLTGKLAPGGYRVVDRAADGVALALPTSAGLIWVQDSHGVADGSRAAPYIRAGSTKGQVWAYDPAQGTWRWATPAPHQAGPDLSPPADPQSQSPKTPKTTKSPKTAKATDRSATQRAQRATQPKPCRDGQYRDAYTGRCRSLRVAATGGRQTCKPGQYRDAHTGRCRSLAATTQGRAKPCKEGQFRNPATGRCKKIASTDDVAKADCGEGRERNPLTNRCRAIKASTPPVAGFAAAATDQSAQQPLSFAGWWALGGVAALALGYGVWEWRHELARLARRLVGRG